MNIERKLQQLRKAKKRRTILPFHQKRIGGIDVSTEQYWDVQIFVKALFKRLKAQRFDIQVTHWGEIYLIEPVRKIHILLSICPKVDDEDIERIKEGLKSTDYFVKEDDGFAQEQLCVLFRAYRPGTKWRRYSLDVESSNVDELVTQLISAIALSVTQLATTVRHELSKDIHQISLEDVMALICYGAAKFGPESQLAHLSHCRDLRSPLSCKLVGDQLTFFGYYHKEHLFLLSPQSMKVFNILLPDERDIEAEFVCLTN